MKRGNFFAAIPAVLEQELIEQLPLGSRALRIERIVSRGHATPEGKWYDQGEHEWVLLLSGSAGLRFEGESQIHILKAGDYVDIPAHCRHRVEWTHPTEETIWLAVFYPKEGG